MLTNKMTTNFVKAAVFTTSSRGVSSKDVKNFFMPKVQPRTDSQKSLLSKEQNEYLYKVQFHQVKPEALPAYKKLCSEFIPRMSEIQDLPMQCVGSWSCWYGDQDQVVHLWRYTDGFSSFRQASNKLAEHSWYKDMWTERSKMLHSRTNQLLYEFSFWNEIEAREGPNIYELRTYHLKPGTMIEWANNWARGIQKRQKNSEAVAGFFSEIGDLNVVHHLWAYKDLENRRTTRQAAWEKPGWDDTVYYTVPLIRNMQSRILIPLEYSPLQWSPLLLIESRDLFLALCDHVTDEYYHFTGTDAACTTDTLLSSFLPTITPSSGRKIIFILPPLPRVFELVQEINAKFALSCREEVIVLGINFFLCITLMRALADEKYLLDWRRRSVWCFLCKVLRRMLGVDIDMFLICSFYQPIILSCFSWSWVHLETL